MTVQNTLLIQVDVQNKLLVHMFEHENLLKNMHILSAASKILGVETLVFEQYKRGLGETEEGLKSITNSCKYIEKTSFSCCANQEGMEHIVQKKQEFVVLFGIEAHVCVLQTALDLIKMGKKVVLVADCVGSRKELDKKIAIKRMMQEGVLITSYESLLFMLLKDAKNEHFKEISKLIK